MNNINSVLGALEQYADTSAGDAAAKARGFTQVICHGNFVLGIKMALDVLDLIENLNRAVQSRQLSVCSIMISIKATTASLHLLRSYAVFQRIYYETVTMCTELDIPLPVLPRQRRAPSRFSRPASSHVPTSAFVFYRVHCFEFIDTAISALERRYSQPGITKYTQL